MSRLRARPRARVKLGYVSTASAAVEVAVLRGRRTVARASGRAKVRRNRLTLRAPRKTGRYTLALKATADDRNATDRVRLTVRKRR